MTDHKPQREALLKKIDSLEARVRELEEQQEELQRTQADLQKSEERYRILVENSLQGICLGRGYKPVFANQTFANMLGYTVEELLDINQEAGLSMIHPDDRQILAERHRARMAGEDVSNRYSYRFIRKDGHVGWFEVTVSNFEYQGEPALLGVYLDITERKQAEQNKVELEAQLIAAQKMESIGRLAAGVAHDFNNLLSPISSYSDLLLEDLAITDPRHDDVAQIKAAAERAKNLTRQLLAFGRKQMLEMSILDLNTVVSEFAAILRRTLREDIELAITYAKNALSFMGDVTQLEQILMNLVVNAQDAMPSGGKLTIDLTTAVLDEAYASLHPDSRQGSHVLLVVSDTGQGMSQETAANIFEPFFTTKDRDKGTGLGLSTVYGIVKQHSGNIWAYSEVGHGTSIRIYFPVNEDRSQTSSPPSRMPPPNIEGCETLLVVEDDTPTREAACRVLKRLGYNVLAAESGHVAVALVKSFEGPIDLVLTDVIMPKMNGKDRHDKLISIRPGLKVIYMSGYADSIISHHGFIDAGTDFIQKPFTKQSLGGKVRQTLDSHPPPPE